MPDDSVLYNQGRKGANQMGINNWKLKPPHLQIRDQTQNLNASNEQLMKLLRKAVDSPSTYLYQSRRTAFFFF